MLRSRPGSVIAMCAFCTFGALASGLSCAALLAPGGSLDILWRINPRAHEGFLGMGGWAIVLMAAVCAACVLCGMGLWMRTLWGYRLAVAGIATNLVADMANALVRGDRRTWIGVPIAGAVLLWLLRSETRRRVVASPSPPS